MTPARPLARRPRSGRRAVRPPPALRTDEAEGGSEWDPEPGYRICTNFPSGSACGAKGNWISNSDWLDALKHRAGGNRKVLPCREPERI